MDVMNCCRHFFPATELQTKFEIGWEVAWLSRCSVSPPAGHLVYCLTQFCQYTCVLACPFFFFISLGRLKQWLNITHFNTTCTLTWVEVRWNNAWVRCLQYSKLNTFPYVNWLYVCCSSDIKYSKCLLWTLFPTSSKCDVCWLRKCTLA